MKQSVEEQIQNAFEKWDDQKSDIGFDKDALWDRMPVADEKKKRLPWFKLVAVAIIFLLSSALALTLFQKQDLKQSHLALQAQVETLENVKPEIETHTEQKIVYKTKEVVSNQAKEEIQHLNKEKLALQSQIDRLRIKLAINSSIQKYLKDSIQGIHQQYLKTQQLFAQKLAELKNVNQNQALEVEIDQEALLALKKDIVSETNPKQAKGIRISFKNKNKTKERTTSIFQGLTEN